MKRTFLFFIYIFLYVASLFSGEIVVGSLVVNRLDGNPLGININTYVDDDKSTEEAECGITRNGSEVSALSGW